MDIHYVLNTTGGLYVPARGMRQDLIRMVNESWNIPKGVPSAAVASSHQ